MSYIYHISDDYEQGNHYSYYKPSDSLENLFKDLVIVPLEDEMPEIVSKYKNYQANKDFVGNFLARTVLKQGQSNFDTEYKGYYGEKYYRLTQAQKVLLYCVHYMPMHLYSSYHLYSRHLMQLSPIIESDNIVLIDFGCGPLTSAIAFWAASRKYNITYVGIDISETMRTKAQKINQYGYHSEFEVPFYPDVRFYLMSTFNQLNQILNGIKTGNSDDMLIIFNFCYFFQSNRLNISRLVELVNGIMYNHYQKKICLVYQNPEGTNFQKN